MSRKKFFRMALGAALGSAAISYIIKKSKLGSKIGENFSVGSSSEEEMYLGFATDTAISFEKADKLARAAAKKRLSPSAAVVSASGKKAVAVSIDGKSRHAFLFGAAMDCFSDMPEGCLFYVDADSGEVFECSGDTFLKLEDL